MPEISTQNLTSDTGTPRGYLATPDGESPTAGIVLLPEYWGLVEHIRDVARRFAREGFVAYALDLFDGETTDNPDEGRRLARSLDHDKVVERVRSDISRFRSDVLTRGATVGLTGWCMGGALTFRCAIEGVGADAFVGFYGNPGDTERLLASPTPTLGIFGAEDHVVDSNQIRQAAEQLREATDRHRFVLATAAPHAFFNDTRESYDADSAAWAWELTLLWFRYWLGVRAPQAA